MKRATILRWTGKGRIQDLESSVGHILEEQGTSGEVSRVGGSLLVRGPEPLGVAAALQHLPGVAWIAVGFGAGTAGELALASRSLAKIYLRKGNRFTVEAEATGGVLASDVAGSVTSRVLETVKGSRSSDNPRVRFRVAADGRRTAVGVQLLPGAGGAPTGREAVSCLVSGGTHSSVVAWMAVLAGYRVRLLHASVREESLMAVAKLYSELSNRADSRWLSLEVLEGESAAGSIVRYGRRSRRRLFAGFHAADGAPPPSLRRAVSSPLYFLPEEAFEAEFKMLRIRAFEESMDWGREGPSGFRMRTFRGGPAGVSDVLDGLK